VLDNNSTLKMEAKCSSTTSVTTHKTTQHHIPEDSSLKFTLLFKMFTIIQYYRWWVYGNICSRLWTVNNPGLHDNPCDSCITSLWHTFYTL